METRHRTRCGSRGRGRSARAHVGPRSGTTAKQVKTPHPARRPSTPSTPRHRKPLRRPASSSRPSNAGHGRERISPQSPPTGRLDPTGGTPCSRSRKPTTRWSMHRAHFPPPNRGPIAHRGPRLRSGQPAPWSRYTTPIAALWCAPCLPPRASSRSVASPCSAPA
jgi:hypothetical protein